jgi:hypothetical protein
MNLVDECQTACLEFGGGHFHVTSLGDQSLGVKKGTSQIIP